MSTRMSWRANRLQRRLGIKLEPVRSNPSGHGKPPTQAQTAPIAPATLPPLAPAADDEFNVTISFLNGPLIEDSGTPIEPVIELTGQESAPSLETAPLVEESVVEEPAPAPIVEEPVVEETTPAPLVEETVVEEPVVEEPTPAPIVEEPVVEEPVVEEPTPAPIVEEPVVEEPVVEAPAPAPVVAEPVVEETAPAPLVEETVVEATAPAPLVEEPVVEATAPAPLVEEPVVAEPVVEETAPAPLVEEFEEPATMETTTTIDPEEAQRLQRERTAIVTIGINYFGQSGELKGCVNDSNNFLAYAQSVIGTRASSTIQLLDTMATSDPFYPTRANIERVLIRVVQEAWEGKCGHILLHYSGHGASITDMNSDEADKKDETLVPVDYAVNGLITDDWLLENVINAIPPEVKLFALIDSCHSGTMLDLRYKVTGDPPQNTLVNPTSSESSSAMLISGCKDEQLSYDVWDAKHGAVGAMTTAWLTEMNLDRKRSAYEIVKSMRASLTAKGYPQTPQLSTSQPLAHPYTIFALGAFD
jgi:hypothetical protein